MTIQSKASIKIPGIVIWLVGIFLVVGAAIYFLKGAKTHAMVETLSTSGEGELLRIQPRDHGKLSEHYIALDADRKASVEQNLLEFRVRYRQLAPQVKVTMVSGSPARSAFADRFVALLVERGLTNALNDSSRFDPVAQIPETSSGIVISSGRKNAFIAKEFLEALAPYLQGRFYLHFDNGLSPGEIEVYLVGEPCFDQYGVVSFLPSKIRALSDIKQACV